MLDTPEFNSPADMLRDIEKAKVSTRAVVSPSALLGTWNACDPDTSGIVRVVVAASGTGMTVQVFGACHPTPCDWGVQQGTSYATGVSATDSVALTATYKFGFKRVIVTGVLDAGSMRVETFNMFTDGSGRSDYYSKGYFCRRKRQ
jgi:hypothetical protein